MFKIWFLVQGAAVFVRVSLDKMIQKYRLVFCEVTEGPEYMTAWNNPMKMNSGDVEY